MYTPSNCYEGSFRTMPEVKKFTPSELTVKAHKVMDEYGDKLLDMIINGEISYDDYYEIYMPYLSIYTMAKACGYQYELVDEDAKADIDKLSHTISKIGRIVGEEYVEGLVKYVLPSFGKPAEDTAA